MTLWVLTMKWNVSNVMKTDGAREVIEYRFPVEPEAVTADPRLRFSEISVSGAIENRAGIVKLALEDVVTLFTECDRCTRPIERELRFETEHLLVEEKTHEDNDYLLVVTDDELDIDELVLDSLMLSLPSKQLCKDDCKGLCPRCGKDLNEGPCGCPEKEPDPRLMKLKDLKL